jgi:hypothetical protein
MAGGISDFRTDSDAQSGIRFVPSKLGMSFDSTRLAKKKSASEKLATKLLLSFAAIANGLFLWRFLPLRRSEAIESTIDVVMVVAIIAFFVLAFKVREGILAEPSLTLDEKARLRFAILAFGPAGILETIVALRRKRLSGSDDQVDP